MQCNSMVCAHRVVCLQRQGPRGGEEKMGRWIFCAKEVRLTVVLWLVLRLDDEHVETHQRFQEEHCFLLQIS